MMSLSDELQVLVVEDNRDLRDCYIQAVNLGGYSVMEAGNGREALDILRHHRPQLIILDLMMPVMDGWEFLREREKSPHLKSIPVLVCSASPDRVPVGLPFLKKPVDIDELIESIDQYCKPAGQPQ
ncbi:MAG: response regulator [Bdellovibrionales bacterium]